MLLSKYTIVIESLEIEMLPFVSDSRYKQHSSTVLETFIEEMPLTILDDPIIIVVQSDTSGID